MTHLTDVFLAVIDVVCAVLSGPAQCALTGVVRASVDAHCRVLTGIVLLAAKGNLHLALSASEPGRARTP